PINAPTTSLLPAPHRSALSCPYSPKLSVGPTELPPLPLVRPARPTPLHYTLVGLVTWMIGLDDRPGDPDDRPGGWSTWMIFGEANRGSFVVHPRSPTFGKAGRDSFVEDPRSPTFGKAGRYSFVEGPRSPTFGMAGRDYFVEDPRSPTFGKVGRNSFVEGPRSPTFGKAGRDSFVEGPRSPTFGKAGRDYLLKIHGPSMLLQPHFYRLHTVRPSAALTHQNYQLVRPNSLHCPWPIEVPLLFIHGRRPSERLAGILLLKVHGRRPSERPAGILSLKVHGRRPSERPAGILSLKVHGRRPSEWPAGIILLKIHGRRPSERPAVILSLKVHGRRPSEGPAGILSLKAHQCSYNLTSTGSTPFGPQLPLLTKTVSWSDRTPSTALGPTGPADPPPLHIGRPGDLDDRLGDPDDRPG
ncbi:hypothetical protein V8G54_017283, partial [Vigna mungo]